MLDIKRHVIFEANFTGAYYDQSSCKWSIQCAKMQALKSKYLVLAIGTTTEPAAFVHEDQSKFCGEIYDPAMWPKQGIDPNGKNVAVVGTGSTGVQIVQAWADKTRHLTLFQRTPNTALPMRHKEFNKSDQKQMKEQLPATFQYQKTVANGMSLPQLIDRSALDDSAEERECTFDGYYERGGLAFWVSSYKNIMRDPAANSLVYEYWARKTRARIEDPRKRNILAPLEPFIPFGAKRPSLEIDFYEKFNSANVDVVDVNENPISTFKPDGIVTKDGSFFPADIVVTATGYSSPIQALSRLNLRGIDAVTFEDIWTEKVLTYLGIMCHDFPNMFIVDGPGAPSEMSNVPRTVEVQAEWIAEMINGIENCGIQALHPTANAVEKWTKEVDHLFSGTLFANEKSRFAASSGPDGKCEAIFYGGGLVNYTSHLNQAVENWTDNFVLDHGKM